MLRTLFILIVSLIISFESGAQEHPNLTLTSEGVATIKNGIGQVPLFQQLLEKDISVVDAEIESGIHVPVPRDMAGGYTHERHKQNFFILQKAGNLYQITGDVRYAEYIKESLLQYAKLYPTLPLHPTNRSYATGKIFWQCLNDANWLVYVSQAYDCIYDFLDENEREMIENDLFIPFARFLSIDNPKFFNRIHNHSTWANAAVGMIGLVMKNKELIEWSLYGLPEDGIDENEVDNDGGYIKQKGVRIAGFLAQLDHSFSPDGYFSEGPYYLRYAIFPFLVYARALHNNMPELDILNYRDGILAKAVDALLQQTDFNGLFFPLNDAQKGMSWNARELVTAVDLMYAYQEKDPALLDIASKQNKVLIDDAGFIVAKDLSAGLKKEFKHKPIAFGDGKDGDEGGVGILRTDETCVVMKYSAQGMGHGHFDKLSLSYYDTAGEVIQDYGAVRWVNIDQKGGGRYLPENQSFGKQSIAHNTIVVDERSHYEGSVKKGEMHHPELNYFDATDLSVQYVSAQDNNAYDNIDMQRSLMLFKDEEFSNPLLIDIFTVSSPDSSQYDLPLWFNGHLLSANFNYDKAFEVQESMGDTAGYQHIWMEAVGTPSSESTQICWFNNGRFYSMTSVSKQDDQLIFGRAGASDPNFNLRHDPVFIQRRDVAGTTSFVNIIEVHGTYDPITEIPAEPFSNISSLDIIHEDDSYIIIAFSDFEKNEWTAAMTKTDFGKENKHEIELDNKKLWWTGPFKIFKNN